jgi:phosphoenolpyruvate synthase/pyruvate phosphate dikinase
MIRSLESLRAADVAIAGGKGASLGELFHAGIPVPSGFVVSADVYDPLVPCVSSELEKEILAAFDALHCEYVAVRSSATAEDGTTASWAGELETFLNTSREHLIQNIERCWASIESDRAKAYRGEKGLDNAKISVAVVVQCMVDAEVSGIAFTVHPVTKDSDSMIIEAGWGLGELVVGGEITPDSYTVRKSDRVIVDVYQNDQEEMLVRGSQGSHRIPVPDSGRTRRKLTDDQVQSLASFCLRIESHYGFPCDIEWAMKDGEFFILQSRPITTL